MDSTRITPQTPATPELEAEGDAHVPRPAQGDPERPDLKAPPRSPDADADALRKGIDVLERVKPY